ncbi:hypothetical protein QL285_029664 [Trifolium repens]|nr:hypothetical protein QL285_029664 [Trifolium repens]
MKNSNLFGVCWYYTDYDYVKIIVIHKFCKVSVDHHNSDILTVILKDMLNLKFRLHLFVMLSIFDSPKHTVCVVFQYLGQSNLLLSLFLKFLLINFAP